MPDRRLGFRADTHQALAWCYYDLGAYAEGMRHCQKVISYPNYVSPSVQPMLVDVGNDRDLELVWAAMAILARKCRAINLAACQLG